MWRLAVVIAATLTSGSTLGASSAPSRLRMRGGCKAWVLEPCVGGERHRVLSALELRGGEESQEEAQGARLASFPATSTNSTSNIATRKLHQEALEAGLLAPHRFDAAEHIDKVVKAMGASGSSAAEQEDGCSVLAKLALYPENQEVIAARGGIESVVGAMGVYGSSEEVQLVGCSALRNLASNEANQVGIAAKGGIEAVVGAMGPHKMSAGVQRYGRLGSKAHDD